MQSTAKHVCSQGMRNGGSTQADEPPGASSRHPVRLVRTQESVTREVRGDEEFAAILREVYAKDPLLAGPDPDPDKPPRYTNLQKNLRHVMGLFDVPLSL